MSALLIAGSPSERSRSAALLDAVAQRLSVRGALVDRIHIRGKQPAPRGRPHTNAVTSD